MANAHHDGVELKTNLVAQTGAFTSGKARLDKRWVHKSYDENVLISHIEAVQPQTSAKKGNEAAETPYRPWKSFPLRAISIRP